MNYVGDMARIVEACAKKHHMSVAQLMADDRRKHVIMARMFTYACMRYTKKSFPQIAAFFGKDHSTVVHLLNKIDKKAPKMKAQARNLLAKLGIPCYCDENMDFPKLKTGRLPAEQVVIERPKIYKKVPDYLHSKVILVEVDEE